MRFATVLREGRTSLAVLQAEGALLLNTLDAGVTTMRELAAGGPEAVASVHAWVARQHESAFVPSAALRLCPAVPDPGAIYTVGLNYRDPDAVDAVRPPRPLIYGKMPGAVAADGAVLTWDRSLTRNVDPEAELGVVIGRRAQAVSEVEAMEHVFGFTVINDISSRDEWLDGDQWLLGKSMAGFCPVGPSVLTADELGPDSLRLGCTINGVAIQDGDTSQLWYSIPELIAYLSRHVVLEPGDLIATGTPGRLAAPLGPERHLEAGDRVTVWVEHIGELTTVIA
jgi:2-keto-4-pentenoate hydratase/2-oxohepta-3-ene-1,7-dioic acid hydratase in catechol pathway